MGSRWVLGLGAALLLAPLVGCGDVVEGTGAGAGSGSSDVSSDASSTSATTSDAAESTVGDETTSGSSGVIPGSTSDDGATTAGSMTTMAPPMTTSSSSAGSSSDGGSSTGPEPVTAHSCAELLEMEPEAETGIHPLLDSEDAEYDAFCLMDAEFDGGGWTLVGRSRAGVDQTPFGWRSTRGAVDVQSDAYSLNAWAKGLEFTEILVADREGGQNLPFSHAYKITVPANFIADFENSTLEHDSATTVLGDCDPGGGPGMLRNLGRTGEDDQFFFRDMGGNDVYGLRARRWQLNYDNCNLGADINDQPGLIFVR